MYRLSFLENYIIPIRYLKLSVQILKVLGGKENLPQNTQISTDFSVNFCGKGLNSNWYKLPL